MELQAATRLIDAPFQPQQGTNANWSRNDCLEACVAMAVNSNVGTSLTVDQVAKRTKIKRHWYSAVRSGMKALRLYGIVNKHQRPITTPQIREKIAAGHLIIALVNYGAWPKELKEVDFDGAHFVLVVGTLTDDVIVHDPLASAPTMLSDGELTAAMANPPGSMGRQAIIVGNPTPIRKPGNLLQLQLASADGSMLKVFDLPESILNSLLGGNNIVVKYQGWDPGQGSLSTSIEPASLMTREFEKLHGIVDHNAGVLDVALQSCVDDRENVGFLPYMDRPERIERGLTR